MGDMEKNPRETKEAEKKASKKASGKPSFGKRVGSYFRGLKSELGKIVWFSREQTFRSSVLVLVLLVVCGLCIGALDFGFHKGLTALANLF